MTPDARRQHLRAVIDADRRQRELVTAPSPYVPALTAHAPDEAIIDTDHALRVRLELERLRVRHEAERQLAAEERGPTATPEIVTLADLAAEPDPLITWRIHGWQPAGARVMLAAARKCGKTTLVGSLLRALVDGDRWLDRDDVQPVQHGTVALVDTEMSRGQLRAWLRAQRIRHAARVHVIPVRGQCSSLDLCDPSTRSQWAVWLRDRDVRYLVLDCLRPILDAIGLDESREAGRYLVAVDALLREADIPEACIVHHMGHLGERARGDSRLRDWPDVEWRVVREDDTRDSSVRYISAYGRDVEQPEARLAYDSVTRRLSLAGGTRRDAQVDVTLTDVLSVLDAEPMSGRAIETALREAGHAHRADHIREALRVGIRAGQIATEAGPRRAILHRRSVSASECVPTASEQSGCECVRPSIEGRTTHSLTAETEPLVHPGRADQTGGRTRV